MLNTPVSPLAGVQLNFWLGDLFMPLEVDRRFPRAPPAFVSQGKISTHST